MLVGETSVTAGEVAFAKGTRIALHDQRPPLQQGLTLREYALSGAADLIALEDDLRTLEAAMAGGDHDPRRCADTRRRRAGSSTQAAGTGASGRRRGCAGSASATRTSTARWTRSRVAS